MTLPSYYGGSTATDYIKTVRAVTERGGETTKQFDDLAAGWSAFRSGASGHAMDALVEAIASGDKLAVLDARLRLEAERSLNDKGYFDPLDNNITARLKDAYSTTAQANFERTMTAYNKKAAELHVAAEAVDLHADSRKLLDANSKARGAWMDAEGIVAELEAAAAAMFAAAELAGADTRRIRSREIEDGTPIDWRLPLAIDPGDADRRAIWAAWDTHPKHVRLGRFGQLVTIPGVTIKARGLEVPRYRRPITIRVQQVHVGRGAIRQHEVDPEVSDVQQYVDLRNRVNAEVGQ